MHLALPRTHLILTLPLRFLLSQPETIDNGETLKDLMSRDSLICGWAGPGLYSMSSGRNWTNFLLEKDGCFALNCKNGYNKRTVRGIGRVTDVRASCARRGASIELQDPGIMVMDLTFDLLGDFEGDLATPEEAPPGKDTDLLTEWCHNTTKTEMMHPSDGEEEDGEEEGVGNDDNASNPGWEAKAARFSTQIYSYYVPEYLCPPLGNEQEERSDRLIECLEPVQAWVLEAAATFAEEVSEMRDQELEFDETGWVAQTTTTLQEKRGALP